MQTPSCPSSEVLATSSQYIPEPPVLDEYSRRRVAMLRDRAAGEHTGAAGLFDALFNDLTPEGRAKARTYVADLRDAADVMRAEGRLADAAASQEAQRKNQEWLTDLRASLSETRLLAERTA